MEDKLTVEKLKEEAYTAVSYMFGLSMIILAHRPYTAAEGTPRTAHQSCSCNSLRRR